MPKASKVRVTQRAATRGRIGFDEDSEVACGRPGSISWLKKCNLTIANSNVIHVDFAKKSNVELALAA